VDRTLENLAGLLGAGPLSGPSFCCCFPFLRSVLLERLEDDSFVLTGLQIIMIHAKMRAKNDDDLFHPKLLPRHHVLLLLIDIIGLYRGLNQKFRRGLVVRAAMTLV